MADKNTRDDNSKAVLFLIISSILWGTSFPGVSFGLLYIPAEWLLFIRFLLAAIISLTFFRHIIKETLFNSKLMLLGALNGVAYLLQFLGQQWVPPGLASLLINAYAIFVPFIAYFLIREKLTPRKIAAALIGLIGVGLVSFRTPDATFTPTLEYYIGIILVFLAGLTWALYATYTKKLQNDEIFTQNSIHTQQLFLASIVYSAAIATVSLFFYSMTQGVPQRFPFEGIIAALYLAVFCTIFPFLLYIHSLENIDVGISTIVLLLEVAVAYLISIVYFKETLQPLQMFGAFLIIIGVWIALKSSSSL